MVKVPVALPDAAQPRERSSPAQRRRACSGDASASNCRRRAIPAPGETGGSASDAGATASIGTPRASCWWDCEAAPAMTPSWRSAGISTSAGAGPTLSMACSTGPRRGPRRRRNGSRRRRYPTGSSIICDGGARWTAGACMSCHGRASASRRCDGRSARPCASRARRRSDAARPPAHLRDVARSSRRAAVGGGRVPRDDGRNGEAHLRASRPGAPAAGGACAAVETRSDTGRSTGCLVDNR